MFSCMILVVGHMIYPCSALCALKPKKTKKPKKPKNLKKSSKNLGFFQPCLRCGHRGTFAWCAIPDVPLCAYSASCVCHLHCFFFFFFHHEQIEWLHFGQTWNRDRGAGYNRNFESTSIGVAETWDVIQMLTPTEWIHTFNILGEIMRSWKHFHIDLNISFTNLV